MSALNIESMRLTAAAIKRKKTLSRREAFDGDHPESRPTAGQQAVLDDLGSMPIRIVRSGNQSGKSQLAMRECAWVFEENHPKWKRPTAWGTEPLLMLIAVNTAKQFEDVLWRKLSVLIDVTNCDIRRDSTGIKSITNNTNGNRIIILYYHNTGDALEKLQGFVGHWALVDEMPFSVGVLEEMVRRVATKSGFLMATFTPKVRNDAIRRWVDALALPAGKVYRLKMFDNPIYASPEKQTQELAKLSGLPEAMRRAILEGEWTAADTAVYFFSADTMCKRIPSEYLPSWRHLLSVDPANESKLGRVVAVEDPRNGHWYITRADYIDGIFIPTEIIKAVEFDVVGLNLVKRVSDPEAAWYRRQASHMGFNYIGVWNKKSRKQDLIKNFQSALGNWLFIDPDCADLIDEISDCSWSETAEGRIINASKYHLLDACQYLVDIKPPFTTVVQQGDWAEQCHGMIRANADALIKKQQEISCIRGGIRNKYFRAW